MGCTKRFSFAQIDESKNIGNYYNEHKFKITLKKSKFVTTDSAESHLFYLPFSVNVMRNNFSVKSKPSIIKLVRSYIKNVSQEYEYWNRSRGADHFFAVAIPWAKMCRWHCLI